MGNLDVATTSCHEARHLRDYQSTGYATLPVCLSNIEVALLKTEVQKLLSPDVPGRTLEKDGKTVRALHGCDRVNPLFNSVTRLPRILTPVTALLGTAVYVYQFKIHLKAAFTGDGWKWHQDYIYWLREDGMPAPNAINVQIFLDEVNEFNGPLMFVPGSHRHGLIDVTAAPPRACEDPPWLQHVSADLKYSLSRADVASLVDRGGIVAPKGPPGTIVLFHPNIVHASGPNLSPFDRTTIIITYNSVSNIPLKLSAARPEFLVNRDAQPIRPLDIDAFC